MTEIEKQSSKEILKKIEKEEGGKVKPTLTKEDMENLFGENGLKRYYKKIVKILKKYMDLDEPYYSLVALWIIGTYLHKQFSSYPYLFFNAMRGSGKTRMLKIIANLSYHGKLVGSMTEAVLFRTARDRTLCIDELESLNAKGNENLKLLLNSAYKKGMNVERMVKRKSPEGESQVVEEFEVYCPIVMANIWGLENILSDRCLSLILEKSNRNEITKLIEIFEKDSEFEIVRGGLKRVTEKIGGDTDIFGDIFRKWNIYQRNIVNKVIEVSDVNDVNEVSDFYDIYDIYDFTILFQNINGSNLSGRDLELFFPLFIIADIISSEVLNGLLKTAGEIVSAKKQTDREENRDVVLFEFIAQSGYEGFIDVASIVTDLKQYLGEDEGWINSRGISRALNRLKLVMDRRSTGKKKQVRINIQKAQEKLLMFKEIPTIQKVQENLSKLTDDEIARAGYTREQLQEVIK